MATHDAIHVAYYIIHKLQDDDAVLVPWANDRPTFKELSSSLSKYIEAIAGYLEVTYNPFHGNQFGGGEEEKKETEEDIPEPAVSIVVHKTSLSHIFSFWGC